MKKSLFIFLALFNSHNAISSELIDHKRTASHFVNEISQLILEAQALKKVQFKTHSLSGQSQNNRFNRKHLELSYPINIEQQFYLKPALQYSIEKKSSASPIISLGLELKY